MTSKNTISDNTICSAGSLHAYVAVAAADIQQAQALRYEVFFNEMGAKPTPEVAASKLDFDEFDQFCDHLIIEDLSKNKVVGTYRVLRRSRLAKGGKFYTETEFDLSKTLTHFKGEVMELGRACVDVAYRDRATIQLLWRVIGEYAVRHNVELMFGCGSFPGADHSKHLVALSYLHHNCLAPEQFRPQALDSDFKQISFVAPEKYDAKRVLATLPPLLKGYLRLGGFIGNGAFEDHTSNTTDVCVVLETKNMSPKYMDKFASGKE